MDKAKIIERYSKWWNNKAQDLTLGVGFFKPECDWSKLPNQSNINNYTAKQFAKNIIVFNKSVVYEGDVLPHYNMDCFGPGVLAAYMGAYLDNSSGNIWFKTQNKPLKSIKWILDYNNHYLNKLIDICDFVYNEVGNEIVIGMTDLGGIVDVLSTFREGENLFYDMMDEPETVISAIKEITKRWHEVFEYLNDRIYTRQEVYTDWSKTFSDKKSYVIQADFCSMLGGEHFDDFVFESIKEQCNRIDRTLYHLDGEGEIRHLDKILSIKNLNAVQWICSPQNSIKSKEAIEIYKKVLGAGKSLQLKTAPLDDVEEIIQILGTNKNILPMFQYYPIDNYDQIMKKIEKIK